MTPRGRCTEPRDAPLKHCDLFPPPARTTQRGCGGSLVAALDSGGSGQDRPGGPDAPLPASMRPSAADALLDNAPYLETLQRTAPGQHHSIGGQLGLRHEINNQVRVRAPSTSCGPSPPAGEATSPGRRRRLSPTTPAGHRSARTSEICEHRGAPSRPAVPPAAWPSARTTGPAVDPVCLNSALPRRAGRASAYYRFFGRDAWPQGQLEAWYSANCGVGLPSGAA
jgi:hypothetical protein